MCSVTRKFCKQIIAAIVFTCLLKSVHLEQCDKLTFNKKHVGQRLVGFTIVTSTEESIGTCVQKCFQLTHCLSTNFDTVSKQCDLNNITADQMPTAVVKSGMSILSDLSAWPKAMVGSCGDKPCQGYDICMPAGNSFHCRNITCGEPPTKANSVVAAGGSSPGDTRQYSCNDNYSTLSATVDMVTTCLEGGSWTTSAFTCLWDCGEPPPYPKSEVNNGNNFAGTTRLYTCDTDYTTENGTISTMSTICVASGTWTPASFTCISDCGFPRNVDNAIISTGATTEGTQRTYTCKANYVTSSQASDLVTTCQANTVLTSTFFSCLLVKTIGEFCGTNSDCKETGSVCIQNICFCSFFHRYYDTTNGCVQVCTTPSTAFVQHRTKRIHGYNFLGSKPSAVSDIECTEICLTTSGCVAVEHVTASGDCYFSELSVPMIVDATPENIVFDNFSNIYVRDCT